MSVSANGGQSKKTACRATTAGMTTAARTAGPARTTTTQTATIATRTVSRSRLSIAGSDVSDGSSPCSGPANQSVNAPLWGEDSSDGPSAVASTTTTPSATCAATARFPNMRRAADAIEPIAGAANGDIGDELRSSTT